MTNLQLYDLYDNLKLICLEFKNFLNCKVFSLLNNVFTGEA